MLSLTDIENALAADRFQRSFEDREALEFVLVRRRSDELFERIRVQHGNGGDAVTVGVEISVVPGRTALKGLCIHRCLAEIAGDSATGWTKVKSANARRELTERIIQRAPTSCIKLAADSGPALLQQTESARACSRRYLGILDELAARGLCLTPDAEARAQVDRIMKQPIVCLPAGDHYYVRALEVIACHCQDIEGDSHWLRNRDADSISDRELMMRLQIIASQLAGESGWSMVAIASP